MKCLESDRLKLRPIERADLTKLNTWKNSEEIYQNLGGGYMPVSIDTQEKWLDDLMDTTGKNKRFMIQLKGADAIGMIGLYGINWIHRTCELGLFIGESEQHGKGLGSEAYRLIEEFAVRYLNIRKIKAFVVSDNDSAVHMYEKLGFGKVGELKAERFINGKYCSVYIMEKFIGGGYFLTDYYTRYVPLQLEVA